MDEFGKVIKRVAPSASRTVHLTCCNPAHPEEFGFIPFEFDSGAVWEDFSSRSNGFFSTQLSSYFLAPVKKTSSIDQRLRNAVHFLVEADNQKSDAIALSLCFSAIEAMVCEKTEGIVDELSRNVASLLEPDALNRPCAIQAIKRLYNLRSKTLHGAVVHAGESIRWQARLLAAAVLKALTEWRRHVGRLGDAANRADFMSELRALSSTGKEMVGVPGMLGRFIPSDESRQPK